MGRVVRSKCPPAGRSAFALVDAYRYLNPHAAFSVYDAKVRFKDSRDSLGQCWKKWKPNEPTSAWWYGVNELADLIRAEVAEGRHGGQSACRQSWC
jgi:hypothetical protein